MPENLGRTIFLPLWSARAEGSGAGHNLARQVIVGHGGTGSIAEGSASGALFRIIR